MATDVVFTSEIQLAVKAVLYGADGATHTGGLPANWFRDADDALETPMKYCDVGDLADWPLTPDADGAGFLDQFCPGVMVRGMGPQPETEGTSGIEEIIERVRVIHLRRFDQCHNATTGALLNRMANARGVYAKIIHKALFHDPHAKLAVIAAAGTRTEVTLTSADGAGAQVYDVRWEGWDLGYPDTSPYSIPEVARIRMMAGLPLWCIGCDLTVRVNAGGEG